MAGAAGSAQLSADQLNEVELRQYFYDAFTGFAGGYVDFEKQKSTYDKSDAEYKTTIAKDVLRPMAIVLGRFKYQGKIISISPKEAEEMAFSDKDSDTIKRALLENIVTAWKQYKRLTRHILTEEGKAIFADTIRKFTLIDYMIYITERYRNSIDDRINHLSYDDIRAIWNVSGHRASARRPSAFRRRSTKKDSTRKRRVTWSDLQPSTSAKEGINGTEEGSRASEPVSEAPAAAAPTQGWSCCWCICGGDIDPAQIAPAPSDAKGPAGPQSTDNAAAPG